MPTRAVFVRRSLMTGALTFGMLVIVGLAVSAVMDLPLFWTLPVAAMMTLGFFIDDSLRWRAHKYDRWEIAEGHLLHADLEGTLTIPLAEIDEVMTRLGNRVILQLSSGQRIALRYLPFPEHAARDIRARMRDAA